MRYGWLGCAVVASACIVSGADAALVVSPATIGQQVVVASTGNVIAKLESIGGGLPTALHLGASPTVIFYGNGATPSPVGTEVDLGVFDAGTILTFRLTVGDGAPEDIFDYYSGSAAMNPDGIAHAAVSSDSGRTYVGFEDLFDGGDFDYDDIVFSFSNTDAAPVPEPASWAMFIGGFGLIGGAMRRRTRITARFA